MLVLALADDVTGALETGAKFRGAGIPSVVTVRDQAACADAPVAVIDTETRHLAPSEAARVIVRCAGASAPLIFKKTDSTLRGNIGVELHALADVYGGARIAFVPAYPALGRVVRDGVLYVDHVPLALTAFARDPLDPVSDSRVRSVLDPACDCDVFDGATDGDIGRAADEILADGRYRIVAGPAAIAEALAVRLSVERQVPEPWPTVRRCLVVNGSLHEASERQIRLAIARGTIAAGGGWRLFAQQIPAGVQPLEVRRETGLAVARLLRSESPDGLIVFGGDTAFGILEALGSPAMRPLGEVLPGVPVSRVDGFGTYWITKAGGFGAEDVLPRLREILDD